MKAWLGCGSIQDLPSDQLLNQYARLPQQVLEGFVRIPPMFQRVLIQDSLRCPLSAAEKCHSDIARVSRSGPVA